MNDLHNVPSLSDRAHSRNYKTLYDDQKMYLQHGIYPKPDLNGFNKSRLHTHLKCELLFILKGKGTVHIEGSKYELRPGTLFLMRPGEGHYIDLDPSVPYDRSTLYFSADLFDSFDNTRSLLRPYFERESGKYNRYYLADYNDTECIQLYKNMLDQPDKINIVMNLLAILQRLNVFYRQATTQAVPETLEYRIIRYIQDHPQEKLSAQILCNKFYISRTQLYRRFKEATGTSINEYITLRRVLQAQELINQGYKPTQCYNLAGFTDYSTFYRAYHKHFGHAPSQTNQEQL